MQITINGEKVEVEKEEIPVSGLLEIKNVESPEMVSAQVNGEVISNRFFARAKNSERF